jgi:exodeoxyribonuclease V beta subunit
VNRPADALPDHGLTCLEASAGTGKTHRLSTLAARWLIERADVRPTDLLVVTYTVSAARELRARIRERLAAAHAHLVGPVGPTPEDLAWLDRADDDRAVLASRAERALAAFDDISISTIHAFAAASLGGSLGTVDTADGRRRQAVADVLAVAAFDRSDTLLDEPRALTSLDETVKAALENPDAALAPSEGADASSEAWSHLHAVERAIGLFAERGKRQGRHTYADLLTELYAALREDDAPLLATLRSRYRIGLIDEFQDTDPFQWGIFRRIFLDVEGRTLVVVGDPKQAIYGFRGADVDTYLAARDLAASAPGESRVTTLSTNYRSDASMLRVLNDVMDGASFDESGEIRYVAVEPAPGAPERAVVTDGGPAPALSLRLLTWGTSNQPERLRAIAEDCAEVARAALDSSVTDDAGSLRALTERDVVVLCRARTLFPLLRAAFLRRGIRTTEAKTDDVLESVAALDVAIALRAMSEPSHAGAMRAVAHSWLASADALDDGVGGARRRVAAWSEALDTRGIASFARLLTDPAASPGLLARAGGERLVTDIHHVCEVLAAAAPPQAGAVQLLETLNELRETTNAADDELRTRRIDTDEPAVRLMTIHGAKGLEFPVVLCPFVQNFRPPPRRFTMWRDETTKRRYLDAGGRQPWVDPRLAAPSRDDRERSASSGEASENRRLLYVALTRAKHRTVVWWEGRRRSEQSLDELTALLLDRDDDGRLIQRPRALRDDPAATAFELDAKSALAELGRHFGALVDDGVLELAEVTRPRESRMARPVPRRDEVVAAAAELGVETMARSLVERASRCSFSSLVASSHDVSSLDPSVGDSDADDEAVLESVGDEEPAPTTTDAVDPFGGLRGTAFGTAIHEALEAAYLRRSDEAFDDAARVGLDRAMWRLGMEPSEGVFEGLLAAASTKIGEGRSLRELARDDVAAELRFVLPVADGVGLDDVARTLLAHRGAGPFAEWASRLAGSTEPRPLAASLVGSVDLVSTLGTDRYYVLDYKTNVVGARGFGRDGLLEAMREADYPLQAILYMVALHRLLRWRLDAYDPERHLGGAHYLFLRGMRPDSEEGVVTWSPGAAAVCAISDLFAGAS